MPTVHVGGQVGGMYTGRETFGDKRNDVMTLGSAKHRRTP